MSRYQFSRSSDQDSSPRKKTRTIYTDSSDEEVEYLSRRNLSQRRRKRFNSGSRSDILTQIQRQLLSPDELARRRRDNSRNALSRIEEEEEEEPHSLEYHEGGRKVVSSRRRNNSIQSSPYHQPSHSQELEVGFKRPLSRVQRALEAEFLSRVPSRFSLREFQNDVREKNDRTSLESRERREVSLSRWPSRSSLRELQYEERLRSSQEYRERREVSLSRWPSHSPVRELPNDERLRSQEFRSEDERRVQSLSRWPSRTSLRDIRYEDKLSKAHAIQEHSLRMDEELRTRRRELCSDLDHREDISYSKRKELLQRIQPLRGSSRDRIQQLPSSRQERVQSVEDSHQSSSVLKDSLPFSRSLPRSQEGRTRKRVPLTVWSSDSDSSEPVVVKESSQPMRQDPRTLILPEDIAALQSQERSPSPSILHTERLMRDESVQSGSVLRSVGVQTEQQLLSSPPQNRISPTDSDSSIPESPPHSKRRKKSPNASATTEAHSVMSNVPSSPTKQRNDQEKNRYSTRSKDRPEAVKKSCLSNRRSFPSDRSEYTDEERKQIVAYIVQNGIHEFVKGNTIWKAMFVDKVCERSWQSMKAQFLKFILPNIDKFDLSSEELLKFKKCEQQARINKDSKGKVVPGHRGWRRNGRYYTIEDDKKLLEYITTKGRHHQTNGVKLWKMMELRSVLPERSWQSMKERYRKVILPNLQRYELSEDDYAKLRGLTRKDTNSKTSPVPKAVRSAVPPKKKHQLHTRGSSPYVNQTYGDAGESTTESFESISPSSADSTTNMISTPTRKAFRALYEKAGKKISLSEKSVSNTLSERPEVTSPVKSKDDLNTVCSTPVKSTVPTKADTPSNQTNSSVEPSPSHSKDEKAKTSSNQMNSSVEPSPSHSKDGKTKTSEDLPPALVEVGPSTVSDERKKSPHDSDSCHKSSPHSKLHSKQPQSRRDLSPAEHSPVVLEKGNTSKHDLQLSVSVNISDSSKNVVCPQNISPSVSEASTVINESFTHEETHFSQITSHQKSNNLDIPMQEEGESEQLVAEGSNQMQMPKCVDTTCRPNCDKKSNVKSPPKGKETTPEERKKSKEWMKRMLMRQKIVLTPIRPPFLRKNTLLDGSRKDMKKRKKKKNHHVNDGKTLCGDEQAVSMHSKETNSENGRTSTGYKVVPKIRSVSGKLRKSVVQNGNHSKRRKILAGDLTKKKTKQVINKSSQDIAKSVTRGTSEILVGDRTKMKNKQVIKKSSQDIAESVTRGTSGILAEDLTEKQNKQAINMSSQDIAEGVTRCTSDIVAGDITKKQNKQVINKSSQVIAESGILAGDLTKKQNKQAIYKSSQVIAESVTRVTSGILAGDLTKKQNKQAINKSSQDIAESVTRVTSGEGEDRTIQPVETNQPLDESELPPCLNNEEGLLHIHVEDGGAATNLCESPAVDTNLDPLEVCSPLAGSSSSPNSVPWGLFRPSDNEQCEDRNGLEDDDTINMKRIGKYREKKIVFISESSESSIKSSDEEWDIRAADKASQAVRETSPEINTQVISVCGTQIIDVCSTQNIDTLQVDGGNLQLCSTCLQCERGSDAEGVVLPLSSCDHQLQESPAVSDIENDHELQESSRGSDGEDDHNLPKLPRGNDSKDDFQFQESPEDSDVEDEEQLTVLPSNASMPYLSTIRPSQSYRTPLANSFVEQADSIEIPETSGRLEDGGPSCDKDDKNISNPCSLS